jgi:hypothetical protein
VNDNNSRFYRGGVQTIVNGQKMDEWNHKSHVMNIVKGWGYAENRFTLWSRFTNYDGGYFQLKIDDHFSEVAMQICGGYGAAIYVDHSAADDGSECDSDDAEGVKFNDSEDERAMGLDDGFGVDTNDEPRNETNMRIVLSSIGVSESESKFEDDEYESEELGSSDPDASDEERGVRYEKFRKDQTGKKYKFKFGMEFNSLPEFRDAIRDTMLEMAMKLLGLKMRELG